MQFDKVKTHLEELYENLNQLRQSRELGLSMGQINAMQQKVFQIWDQHVCPWLYDNIPIYYMKYSRIEFEKDPNFNQLYDNCNFLIYSYAEIVNKFLDSQRWTPGEEYIVNVETVNKFNRFVNENYSAYFASYPLLFLNTGIPYNSADYRFFPKATDPKEVTNYLAELIDRYMPTFRGGVAFFKILEGLEKVLLHYLNDHSKPLIVLILDAPSNIFIPFFKKVTDIQTCNSEEEKVK